MHNRTIASTLLILFAAAALPVVAGEVPAHPSKIDFPELNYRIPAAAQYRAELSNGMVVYIAEDRMLPTFDLTVTIRTGSAFDPPGKVGLASIMGQLLREGGTQSMTPEEFDERADFLAAQIFSSVGDTGGSAGISLLSKDIDDGMTLLLDMLRNPRFDEERFRQIKDRRLQNIKRRNDSSASVEEIEWGFLLNGEDHFSNEYPSSESINAITRDDLLAFHKRFYHPGNMILAVTGDFDRGAMLARLEKAFADWPAGETAPKDFPAPRHTPKPGIYMVEKEGVNQGRVSIGHKSCMRGTPDEYALTIMNTILGGGSFRTRLFSKIRSDEGLAYSVGSMYEQGVYYPGDFRCFFQSKSNSCAYATKLVIEEIRRLKKEPVTEEELKDAIAMYVESLPQRFQTKMALMRQFVSDEYTGRDPAYWQSYVKNLKAVTIDDVQRVAREHLHPDKLVILAVGDVEAMKQGGADKAPGLTFGELGAISVWEPRDPDTLRR